MLCGLSCHEEQTRAFSLKALFKAPPTTSHVAEGTYPACYCCRGGHCIAEFDWDTGNFNRSWPCECMEEENDDDDDDDDEEEDDDDDDDE
ncbi:hypothetical protein M0804_004734 [Polistes exclamans]|nr:hypothetical protein M0804_004734 [Polistes exclamans]